ncbi:MAG: energy transducer TonB [Thermodesulfovibrionales bacterium]|nr:energy transducer TonB [Thermodesulfovibrionales bacterium]
MREPSLQKTTALSLALHLTALLTAFIVLKQSNHLILPSPYTVSLVSPEVLRGDMTGEGLKTALGVSESLRDTSVMEDVLEQDKKKWSKKEEEIVKERISAIEAKKRVEQIVRLRSMISLKASGGDRRDRSETTPVHTGGGGLFDDYYTKIRREIRQQWVFPDIGQNDLETIISMKIMKDGTISVQKIEKSSGNPFFDRSAIKALSKASPLPPPPYEMEIGVRFSL